jgi:hypothetical protein
MIEKRLTLYFENDHLVQMVGTPLKRPPRKMSSAPRVLPPPMNQPS